MIFIITLICANIIFAGGLYRQIRISKAYVIDLDKKDAEIDQLTKSNDDILREKLETFYLKNIKKLLSEQELVFLAQKQWEYILSINGNSLKQNRIYIEEDSARITLAEIVYEKDILPKEVLSMGTITGNDKNDPLGDHFQVITNTLYSVKVDESDNGRRIVYEFKDIPRGTIINIKLSPMLAERLSFQENWLELIRK